MGLHLQYTQHDDRLFVAALDLTQHALAYLHFDDVLLSLGSLLPGKVLCLCIQPLLKQWQCQLGADGCSRVIAGHIDELGLQMVQHGPPIF